MNMLGDVVKSVRLMDRIVRESAEKEQKVVRV